MGRGQIYGVYRGMMRVRLCLGLSGGYMGGGIWMRNVHICVFRSLCRLVSLWGLLRVAARRASCMKVEASRSYREGVRPRQWRHMCC